MRALAEENIAHTREIYERSKDALEAVLDSWERTFGAAGQGAVALNHKIIDIAQRNINSGFDLAKSMAGAKNIAEATELKQHIGASNSTHSQPRRRKYARYQLGWPLMPPSRSRRRYSAKRIRPVEPPKG
jgi:hypothetical protein